MQTRVDETGEGRAPDRPEPAPSPHAGDLLRFEGARAEIAYLGGALQDAEAAGDPARERDACIRLAHLYVQRGTNLDAAVGLARRALGIEDDPTLRSELAGWLAGLGDPAGAGLELRGTSAGSERGRARPLVQAGVLMARARRADAAALVLEEAAEVDPADPIPLELIGTLSSWAAEIITPQEGALSYMGAAKRRAAAGDDEAALEDLLRAFELCPSSADAANAVAGALRRASRPLAADETLRDHAAALEDAGHLDAARDVHVARLASALEGDDIGVALSAALDLDLSIPSPRAEIDARIDDALALAGLSELAAARMYRRAASRTGPARALAFEGLARHLEGSSASDDRSLLAWIESAVADPAQSASLDALRAIAERTGDHEPLVDALIRIVSRDRSEAVAPAPMLSRLALELAGVAAQRVDDPRLADWAFERARSFDPTQADAAAHFHDRLQSELARREADLAKAEAAVLGRQGAGATTREGRVGALRSLAKLLGMSPASEEQAVSALAALCRAEPKDAPAARTLRLIYERAPGMTTRSELYESVLRARLEAPLGRREHVVARLELAMLVQSDGSGRRALDELAPLLDASELDSSGASHALLAAIASGQKREEGRALAALAATAERHTAALLHASAADAYRRAALLGDARKEAERALDLDPACSRAAAALARVAAVAGGRDAAVAIERALGLVVPRAWLCDALARCLETIGEQDLAFAWTHRWLALAPSDRRAISELLRRCQLGTDPSHIAEALTWVLAQPDPPDERAPLVLDALTLLFGLDRARGGQVGRRVLDVLGPTSLVRDRLGALADEHDDAGLAIALLERTVAADSSAPRDLFVELAHRRAAVSDFDGAAQELLRAATADVDPASLLDAAEEIEAEAGLGSDGSTAPPGLGSDGVVAIAEVRARSSAALLAMDPGEVRETASRRAVTRATASEAWRTVGAVRWDLAHDPRGAELALFSAAEAGGDRASFELYARDLCELAGADKAVAALFERLASLDEAPAAERVALALAAGNLAAEHGLARWALDGALAALAVEASNADAISLAESQAPHVDGGEAAIDHIYEALAGSALGKFGRRAAHYRAARQLERLGARELALKHALKSFEAVPTEGTSWSVLARLVDPVRGSEEAVELFQRVAASAKGDDKAGWYRRAIELSGSDRAGLERRFTVIARALGVAPDASLVESLAEVVERFTESGGLPETTPATLSGLARSIVSTVEGPDGARTSARLSRVLIDAAAPLDSGEIRSDLEDAAFRALDKAVEIDGDLEVFERISPSASSFAAFPDAARGFVQRVIARTQTKHALVGGPLLRFASAIADNVGDATSSSDLLAEAERREASEPGTPSNAPLPVAHEDPFADPSLLESAPPPAQVEVALPTRRLELHSEPPASTAVEAGGPSPGPSPGAPPSRSSLAETPAGLESLLDLGAGLFDEPAPRPASGGRRASSGNHLAVRVPELSAIRDGFDALFDGADPLPADRLASIGGDAAPRDAEREVETSPSKEPHLSSSSSIAQEPTEEELRSVALEASREQLRAGDAASALTTLDRLPVTSVDPEVAQTRVEILRKSGDVFSLVLAIDQRIALGDLPDEEVARLLVEGSRASASAGDQQGALIRARRAARLAPELPDATLESIALDYKSRGTGTPREAQSVVDTLQAIQGPLEPALAELHTFLLAESTDVIHGGGAGLRELSHRHAEIGALPLIALGMAERLARSRSFDAAVPLFARALEGDLRGMRNKARVALASADAAIQAGQLVEARAFLDEAEQASELRSQIERRRREILAFDDDPEIARPVIEALLEESTGTTRARLLQRLARMHVETDFERSVELYEEALVAARRDRKVADVIRTEILGILESRGLGQVETIPAPTSSEGEPLPSSSDVVDVEPSWIEEARADSPVPERTRERVEPLGPLAPAARPLFLNSREEDLFDQLLAGYLDAGDALVDSYAPTLDARARDVLVVRRHQVALKPGVRRTIAALREAALAERDEVYARALEHVLSIETGEVAKPPPLHAQPREPDLLSALLYRDVSSRETEVLGVAWEAGMFRRELTGYGVTGSDRVALTARSVLGETYSEIAAALGAPRPLFHKRSDATGVISVALLAQPAIVASGELRAQTPDIVHRLASMHASAAPDLVLAAHLDEPTLRRLFEAMMTAFGPVAPREEAPSASSSDAAFRADVARLASELWQRIEPRSERRLHELCSLGPLDAAVARATARKAMRRAALFATGDLGLCLRLLAQEEGHAELAPSDRGSLERASEMSSDVADLVRLATRMEYAEARWQLPSPASMRR